MRYELTDDEWATIKPMLPNKPRGVPRVVGGEVPERIGSARLRFRQLRHNGSSQALLRACAIASRRCVGTNGLRRNLRQPSSAAR